MPMKRSLVLLSALMAASGAVSAQAPPTPTTPPPQTAPPQPAPRSSNCEPTRPVPQKGTIAPDGTTTGQSAEPLGDKLARSNGVLCPPSGVDPEIRAPTPDTGNTPVIPPPGSPGGDPNLRPK
jgi:hypothetical protein